MKKVIEFFEKSNRINLILFLVSFLIYFIYFHHIFFNINSILSSITSDSLKNYYTYVYHVKNDPELLQFTGMNYPYGEHIIYTDCQPILTFILRLLPFTHNYLIGIMHALIFLSFIITPLILNKILIRLNISKLFSFFAAIAIALLSPQFFKINSGHFALAYGCIIPLSILFTLQYLNNKTAKNLLKLFVFNTGLFLLHPYLAFCLSVFSFVSLFLIELLNFDRKTFLKNNLAAFIQGILPLMLFKIFMSLTDKHTNRTTEPFGAEVMVENIASVFGPVFGPFQSFLDNFFSNKPNHYEGHTYLGFFTVVLLFVFVVSLPFIFRKIKIQKEILVILLASVLFLFISFGWHIKVLNFFHLESASLNQFRAVCRFSWIFYFTLPLFLITVCYHSFKNVFKPETFTKISLAIGILFFSFNLLEAHSFFKLNEVVYWSYRNIFHKDFLNNEEKNVLLNIGKSHPQVILPLPLFHGGSEMYERVGSNNSMIPSMIYSYHSGTPIMSVLMSRTSLTETKGMIQLLNSYKKEKDILPLLSENDFFILRTKDALLPDESRLLKHVSFFAENDSLGFGYISRKELLLPKIDNTIFALTEKTQLRDSANVVYVPFEDRKPFLPARIIDYETIFILDSNRIASGTYILSFHYYYTKNTYRGLATNLIINRSNTINAEWEYYIPVRQLSGFYEGFAVFEQKIYLEKNNKYEFILNGSVDEPYHVSDFMLRPENTTVKHISTKRDTVINNYPN
ncbi:hypothetical protein [Aurantibacillus circumpalustris]|uniref:hypothetical protein n=1 Tax=Aurantibacillus circumpalustris TaxID=3036359 RepID=UPI00295B4916|nr:hypothetical protein [Aurantibacillus circumpalustris]